MKFYLPIALVLFAACNNGNTGNPTGKDSAAVSGTEKTFTPEIFPAPFYEGGEDGVWNLRMDMEQNGSYTATLTHNGQTMTGTFSRSPLIVNNKPAVTTNETLFEGVFESAGKGESTEIHIYGEPCSDKSDRKKYTSCKIIMGKQEMKACGEYMN